MFTSNESFFWDLFISTTTHRGRNRQEGSYLSFLTRLSCSVPELDRGLDEFHLQHCRVVALKYTRSQRSKREDGNYKTLYTLHPSCFARAFRSMFCHGHALRCEPKYGGRVRVEVEDELRALRYKTSEAIHSMFQCRKKRRVLMYKLSS